MSKHLLTPPALLAAAALVGCSTARVDSVSPVRIWEEPLVIPTYQVGEPDPNPRFYAGRAYQGAQGRVYPYPMLDMLTDTRQNQTYNAVYLENEYARICVLPEIGGRLFAALDKTNNYNFLYRQHVIKPALIGMLGAWISGGIEWNVPHHHRATTFMPVAYTVEAAPNGGKTVWLGAIERRHRMKWLIGLTLYPRTSYLEVTVKVFNRTPFATSFLYWANAAVHANENYQVIFPPSTQFAAYHGKNQFARWPFAREFYRGVDYTSGVDVSWWKNHPRPVSFFAWKCPEDFLAGYDHGQEAGVVHVANRHVVPGKKFWEWGPGPQGRMWDQILTETDGPYVELMVGAYSDNQPDYSWLQPYEAKIVKHYWYPIRELGGVTNANLDAAVNLEVTQDGRAQMALNTTARHEIAKVVLTAGEEVLLETETEIAPDKPFRKDVNLPRGLTEEDLRVSLLSCTGQELIAYEPVERKPARMPEPVKAPPAPEDIETVEGLYLAGLRLEQFYSPALDAYPYYTEALERDPGDYRVNVALGIHYLKRGLCEEAERHFRIALRRVTLGYTAPRDGEAYYYLGLALKFQQQYDAAYGAFYKATWSYGFHAAAYYHLAEIACIRADIRSALDHIDRSIATNAWNTKALAFKCALLRRLGRTEEAAAAALAGLTIDPLDEWAANELYLTEVAQELANGQSEPLRAQCGRMSGDPHAVLEVAVDYGNCGLWDEAIAVLARLIDRQGTAGSTFPMLYYYAGYFVEQTGKLQKASQYYRRGADMPPDYCFPYRLESIDVLRAACRAVPSDARAHYYLGNLLYDHQPRQAIREWEASRALDAGLATVHRNLGLAYARVENDPRKGHVSLERAIARDDKDPRLLYELDVLAEVAGVSAARRLEVLRENHAVIVQHNDALSREIVLLTQAGYYDEAIELMTTRHFRKWEGVGNIHGTYVDAHLLRGRKHLEAKRYEEALKDYQAALEYPENLEVARPYDGGRACQVHCFMGAAYEAVGDEERAESFYAMAAGAKLRGGGSELHYYQGLALRRLGEEGEASRIFEELIESGKKRLEASSGREFFAKFGEQRRREEGMAAAHYLTALGYAGKGDKKQARAEYEKALELNANHLWARIQLSEVE